MEDNIEQIDYKYKILHKISLGDQNNILLVEEKETNKIYIAKVSKNDSYIDTEINILNMLKEVNNEYIIKIINSGEGDIIRKNKEIIKSKYIILEYISKYDLSEYIRFPQMGFGEKKSKLIF